jgi:hypothetical protein
MKAPGLGIQQNEMLLKLEGGSNLLNLDATIPLF